MDRKRIDDWLRSMDPRLRRLLAAAAVVGAALVAFSAWGAGGGTTPVAPAAIVKPAVDIAAAPTDKILAYASVLDQEMTAALRQIHGAGSLSVTVTLASSPTMDYAQNTSQQKTVTDARDSQGGTQTTTSTTSSDQVVTGSSGAPILSAESAPRVIGALVVASGAQDPLVRQTLTQAVETLLGLPPYAVSVLPKGA